MNWVPIFAGSCGPIIPPMFPLRSILKQFFFVIYLDIFVNKLVLNWLDLICSQLGPYWSNGNNFATNGKPCSTPTAWYQIC